MHRIAIIPARSGSKGLKNKNIIDLCGKPLLAYSIEAAFESKLFDRVIVSTDSKIYGEISEHYGAEVIYRDERLSSDSASTFMVLEDLLKKLTEAIDYFVLLQPTSPMRTATHIIESTRIFEANMNEFDFMVSVKEADPGKILVNPLGEDGSMKYFDTNFSNYKRQNYKDYTPNGAIYIAKREAYLEQKHFFGARSIAYIMNELDSVDIDDELDYEFACLCMKKKL